MIDRPTLEAMIKDAEQDETQARKDLEEGRQRSVELEIEMIRTRNLANSLRAALRELNVQAGKP